MRKADRCLLGYAQEPPPNDFGWFPMAQRRVVKERDMTIAVGLLYNQGLLLCTDTQYSGAYKIHGTKLLREEYDDGSKSVFATVGHWRYARMCVQLIQDQIRATPAQERTLAKMHMIVATGLRVLYQEHLFRHPLHDQLTVQFALGLWSAKDGELGFYSTEETAVVRLFGYDCLGSGEQLGHYLIRPRYKRVTNTRQMPQESKFNVLKLAALALGEIKEHDPNVGGESEYVTLTRNGELSELTAMGSHGRPLPQGRKGSRRA